MHASQEWRQSFFQSGPITDESLAEDLAHGIVYLAGRDHSMRPTLVIRPRRIPQAWYKDKRSTADRLVRLLVFNMEYFLRFMAVPGRSEGGVVLFDLGGLGLHQVPLSPLTDICRIMSSHYVNRVSRFYILNMPPALSRVSSIGMRLLTERQRQKLVFLRRAEELQQDFAPHQLEEDLGGARAICTSFWPFPLPPGPFEPDAAGSSAPRADATAGLHAAITASGMLGRLWDPSRSREENLGLALAAEVPTFGRRRQSLALAPLEALERRPEGAASADAAQKADVVAVHPPVKEPAEVNSTNRQLSDEVKSIGSTLAPSTGTIGETEEHSVAPFDLPVSKASVIWPAGLFSCTPWCCAVSG